MGIEFIAGTGAIYSMIPGHVAEALQLKEVGKRRFRIANGEVVKYLAAEAYIVVERREVTKLVVIGSEGTIPLLGVATPELLGLQVDPVTGRLKPMELALL